MGDSAGRCLYFQSNRANLLAALMQLPQKGGYKLAQFAGGSGAADQKAPFGVLNWPSFDAGLHQRGQQVPNRGQAALGGANALLQRHQGRCCICRLGKTDGRLEPRTFCHSSSLGAGLVNSMEPMKE